MDALLSSEPESDVTEVAGEAPAGVSRTVFSVTLDDGTVDDGAASDWPTDNSEVCSYSHTGSKPA